MFNMIKRLALVLLGMVIAALIATVVGARLMPVIEKLQKKSQLTETEDPSYESATQMRPTGTEGQNWTPPE